MNHADQLFLIIGDLGSGVGEVSFEPPDGDEESR